MPLLLEGPSVGLANMAFKDMKLVLTIGITVDKATLNFGGGNTNAAQPSTEQSNSGISIELGGILGTFDVIVDVLGLLTSSSEGPVVEVPGKFGLEIATLKATVPDVVTINATGIKFTFDPNFKADGVHFEVADTSKATLLPQTVTDPVTVPTDWVTLFGAEWDDPATTVDPDFKGVTLTGNATVQAKNLSGSVKKWEVVDGASKFLIEHDTSAGTLSVSTCRLEARCRVTPRFRTAPQNRPVPSAPSSGVRRRCSGESGPCS